MKLRRRFRSRIATALGVVITGLVLTATASATVLAAHRPFAAPAEPVDLLYLDGPTDDRFTHGVPITIRSPAEGLLEGNFSPYVEAPGAGLWFVVNPTDQAADGLWWHLEFGAPPGQTLVPGSYTATDDPYLGTGAAYLRLTGNSIGCQDMTGTFEVLEATFDPEGKPTSFAASFRQSCSVTVLSGEIRYHSTVDVRARDVLPTIVTAPDTLVGEASAPLPITLVNTGTTTLHPIAPATAGPVQVSSDACAGITLAPAASCVVHVRFVPTLGADHAGTVTLHDDTITGEQGVTVHGNGIAPTTTTLVSTVNPNIVPSSPTTLIVTVQPAPPDGYVDIYVDGVKTGGARLHDGVGKSTFAPLTGPRTVVAKFQGYEYWLPSQSTALIQQVRRQPGVAVWASQASAPPGHPVAVGAELRPQLPVSGGTLTLVDELTGKTIADVTQPGISIFACLPDPVAGVHRIRATYSGHGDDLSNTAWFDVTIAEDAAVVPGPVFTLGLTVGDTYCAALRTTDGSTLVNSTDVMLDAQATGRWPYIAVRVSNDAGVDANGLLTNGTTLAYGSAFPWSLADFGTDGERHVWWQLQDETEDWGPAMLSVFVLDRTAPSGTIVLDAGQPFANKPAIGITASATDDRSPISHVAISNDGGDWTTRAYASEQDWTLATGDGQKTIWVKWRDAAGNWSAAQSASIVLDTTPPTTAAPGASLAPGTLTSIGAVPISLSWHGLDATSGVERYELGYRIDRATWTPISSNLTVEMLVRSFRPGHAYAFRIRAADAAGNTGGWVASPDTLLSSIGERASSITYDGLWSDVSGTAYADGRARVATIAGATATYRFNGRTAAWLGSKGPGLGEVEVYVDGVFRTTVNLFSASVLDRQVLFAHSWANPRTHTITLINKGIAGHPGAIVDGFYAIGPRMVNLSR